MFDRWELLIGKDNLSFLQKKTVLVVGIGGVGGSCVLSLVRSGIERIIIIDYDCVDLTNLNRQAVAYQSTVGKKKVEVMKSLIFSINPNCEVILYGLFLDSSNIEDVFDKEKPDYVVDACDAKETKKAIILECLHRNIPFVSSMGTGNKLDPSQLEITDIRKTVNDPLARLFRKWVKEEKIKAKIMVLSSRELPKKTGRVVSSSSFVPNSAGLLIASYVVRDILSITNS